MTRLTLICAGVWIMAAAAFAKVQVEPVEYKAGEPGTPSEETLLGYIAWNDELSSLRPAVIVVHEWWGITEHPKRTAERLAELGYVAFAVDMYGKGKLTSDAAQAGQWAGEVRGNPEILRRRFEAALRTVRQRVNVDPTRVAAIGYCFGGTVVLEAARAGMDIRAVVSLHGTLSTKSPAQPGSLRPSVLVLHGADDPMVPQAQVAAFEEEMRAAKADWQLVAYGGAVHAFTNPDVDKAGLSGAKYNEIAARRSWQAMCAFLDETIGYPKQ